MLMPVALLLLALPPSRRYERELRKLRAELQQKSKDLVDKRLVLQVGAWFDLRAGLRVGGWVEGGGPIQKQAELPCVWLHACMVLKVHLSQMEVL